MSSEFTECLGEGGNNPLVAEDFLLGFTVTSLAPEIHKNSNILPNLYTLTLYSLKILFTCIFNKCAPKIQLIEESFMGLLKKIF